MQIYGIRKPIYKVESGFPNSIPPPTDHLLLKEKLNFKTYTQRLSTLTPPIRTYPVCFKKEKEKKSQNKEVSYLKNE